MIKYWLIIFLFNTNGDFIGKQEYPTANKVACVAKAQQVTPRLINKERLVQYYCVTDDHYHGRKFDKGIPLD